MNKHAWVTVVITVLFLSMSAYTYTEIQTIHENINLLNQNIGNTNNNIKQLADNTNTALSNLGQDLKYTQQEFNTSISTVKNSITGLSIQNQEQFRQLDTQLNTVKQESQQKIDQLEEQISLNLKTGDFTNVIEDVIKSIVSIQTDKSLGSGVFVADDGIIITNYHVIDGATAAAIITHDGDQHSVSVLGYDNNRDLAILKIDDDYPHLKFANSNNLQVGQRVIALGNPGGLQFTVTEGIISATNRKSGGNTYVQTDVPINPGNSGGPLVDASGRIVGINTLKAKDLEGIGFAIPSNDVENVLDELLDQLE